MKNALKNLHSNAYRGFKKSRVDPEVAKREREIRKRQKLDRERLRKLDRKRNFSLSLPKNKLVRAKVSMRGGKVQVIADESLLGHAGGSGYIGNPRRRKRNLALSIPKNKWINAKVQITSDGKVQALVDESVLGHAGASGHVSLNPRRRKAKRKTARRRKR